MKIIFHYFIFFVQYIDYINYLMMIIFAQPYNPIDIYFCNIYKIIS